MNFVWFWNFYRQLPSSSAIISAICATWTIYCIKAYVYFGKSYELFSGGSSRCRAIAYLFQIMAHFYCFGFRIFVFSNIIVFIGMSGIMIIII